VTARQDDHPWLLAAIAESRKCPPSTTAYSVGAVVVDAGGHELARGYSRETDDRVHAEELALERLAGIDLSRATVYTSLEPCSTRRSRPRTCTELIIDAGVHRVVFALREPPAFVAGHGADLLLQAGVEVTELEDLAALVWKVNGHILGPQVG
jgi:diaminohydroxyphosphoribosylaminopyrimidine deaminase/5-amino-6-(5-phosphoribosylamino)uracil reductase